MDLQSYKEKSSKLEKDLNDLLIKQNKNQKINNERDILMHITLFVLILILYKF